MSDLIYADYNATTPLCEASIAKMLKAFEIWGNPSSVHRVGQKATQLMEECRRQVSDAVGCKPSELVFTSGGSESNTLALLGTYLERKKLKLITSDIEHSSVGATMCLLQSMGAEIQKAPVLRSGIVDLNALEVLIEEFKPDMVSLMTANNETGTINPISQISEFCQKAGVLFHTDAVQAFGKISKNHWASADLVSVSGHKIGGPKGIGALIIRNNVKLMPTNCGGSQEIKRRGGTQNVIGICGFAGACEVLPSVETWNAISTLRNEFESKLQAKFNDISIQGADALRVPNTSNLRIPGVPSEVLLSALDLDGVCVSAGSACSSGSVIPSHVLTAIGLTPEEAKECIRFSWAPHCTAEEFEKITSLVINHVNRIRERRRG